MEIMAAIEVEHQQHLAEDKEKPLPPLPTMKSKKSFMQKLMEGHEALKLQMRSPRLDVEEDARAPSRASSSSSAHKDFFKIATAAKSERPIAMRYDDISDSAAPTPVFVASPVTPSSEFSSTSSTQEQKEKDVLACTQRQCRRESSVMEMNATHRLYTSHSMTSMGSTATSPRTAVRFAPPLKARSRSLPSQMTDEQMDAWLDMPEDADAHRLRKASEASARAEYNKRNASIVKRKPVARHDSAVGSPVVFKRDDPFCYDAEEARREIDKMFALDAEETSDAKEVVTLSSLPLEVVLQVTRLLDVKDAMSCRLTCKKMHENMLAPQQPSVAKKT